jgi:hypothetical protein
MKGSVKYMTNILVLRIRKFSSALYREVLIHKPRYPFYTSLVNITQSLVFLLKLKKPLWKLLLQKLKSMLLIILIRM